jgi:DNA-binding protein HU-beta
MNKRHVVERIAAETRLTKTDAARALESFLSLVRSSLANGEKITLMGFGTFAVACRKPRMVREPAHGTAMRVGARRVARFAPGLELRMAVGNGPPSNTDDNHIRHSRSS